MCSGTRLSGKRGPCYNQLGCHRPSEGGLTLSTPDDSPGPDGVVSLREITADSVRAICRLQVTDEQSKLVAPNSVSYQGRGFGRRAVELVIEHVRTRPGAKELLLSHGRTHISPERFYKRLGFEHTGEMMHDEYVMRLAL